MLVTDKDIIRAVKNIIAKSKDISEYDFSRNVYYEENRISGIFQYRIDYSIKSDYMYIDHWGIVESHEVVKYLREYRLDRILDDEDLYGKGE